MVINMNKKILILGSAGNIGNLLLNHESLKANNIISVDINELPLEFKNEKNINHYKLDLTNSNDINTLEEILAKETKKLSSVILASALDSVPKTKNKNPDNYAKGIEFANLDEIQKRINVNITSQLFIIKCIYKHLDKDSHILLFSSIYGLRSPDHRIYKMGFIKPIEYSTSKSAIIGLTKHLSITLALKKKGRANCLVLGGLFNKNQDKSFQKKYLEKVPLGRMLNKDDILNAYEFLTSEKSSYITGSSLVIDGGYTAW